MKIILICALKVACMDDVSVRLWNWFQARHHLPQNAGKIASWFGGQGPDGLTPSLLPKDCPWTIFQFWQSVHQDRGKMVVSTKNWRTRMGGHPQMVEVGPGWVGCHGESNTSPSAWECPAFIGPGPGKIFGCRFKAFLYHNSVSFQKDFLCVLKTLQISIQYAGPHKQ